MVRICSSESLDFGHMWGLFKWLWFGDDLVTVKALDHNGLVMGGWDTVVNEIKFTNYRRPSMYNSIAITSNSLYSSDVSMQMRMSAVTLFTNILNRSKRSLFLHKLIGKQNQMPVLMQGENRTTSRQKSGNKVVTVSLDKIVGSESRVHDFDKDFRPLVQHTRDRWVGIAMAVHQNVTLPPVELIQRGDEYYVRDGHHRISVAKIFGQATIEARIV